MDLTPEQRYQTECMIAGLQELIDRANKEYPYYIKEEDKDPYTPELFYYELVGYNGIGMALDNYSKDKEMTAIGLKILQEWCK